MNLRLDWCSHEAAKFAVEHWHYSRRIPPSKLVKIGVWEEGKFVGAVVFGMGATPAMCRPYGLTINQVCELVRVALRKHQTPVSKIVSISLRMLRKHCPDLKLCISFADPVQGHLGKIYQAGNWIYTGQSPASREFLYKGRWIHGRAVSHLVNQTGIDRKVLVPTRRTVPGKYRYVMPFTREILKKILALRKPYPKCAGSVEIDALRDQRREGGVNPTPALHENKRPCE